MSQESPAEAPDGAQSSDDRALRRDTMRTTASGLAVFALAFLTGPILAQVLGASGRGSVAAVVVPTMVLGWILMFGLPPSVAYYARIRERRQLIMSTWAFTLFVGVPVVAIIWPFVPRILDQHPDITVPFFRASLLAALLVLPFTATIDWLRGVGRNSEFNLYRLLQYVLNTLFLVVLFVTRSLTLTSALAAALFANLIAWVTTLVVNRSLPGRGFRRKVFKEQVNYGARTWVGTFSTMVIARFDQVLMVGLVSPDALGLYVVAATAAQITGPIGQGVSLSLLPHLRSGGKSSSAQTEMTGTALRWTLLASGSVALLAVITAPFLLPLVYGSEFSAAVIPLYLLLPGQICLDMATVIMSKLQADNRPGAASTAAALGAGITVVFVAPAVSVAGIRGAAVVTSLSQAAMLAYMWWANRRGPRAARRADVDADDAQRTHESPVPDEDPVDAVDAVESAIAAPAKIGRFGTQAPFASTSLAGFVRLDDAADEPGETDGAGDGSVDGARSEGAAGDLTPLLGDPPAFAHAVNTLVEAFVDSDIDRVVGIESSGFAVGSAVAYRLGVAFVPLHRNTQGPGEHISESCVDPPVDPDDDPGRDPLLPQRGPRLFVSTEAITEGERVLVVDDVLATGATAGAAVRLVERLGGTVAGLGFVLELERLGGRKMIEPRRVVSLVHR